MALPRVSPAPAHTLQRRATVAAVVPKRSPLGRRCQAANQQSQPGEAKPDAPSTSSGVREFNRWGVKVLESDSNITGPEAQKDMFEGEAWENFGVALQKYFYPAILVLGLVCGGVAARSYNDGATAYVQSATSPDVSLSIVPADVVERTLLSAPPTN